MSRTFTRLVGLWVRVRERRQGRKSLYGLRLFLAYGLSLLLVCVGGYGLITREQHRWMVSEYARTLAADAGSIAFAAHGLRSAAAIRRVGLLVDVISRRPGVIESIVVDQGGVVRAAGNDDQLYGRPDGDPSIDAALRYGSSYAGPGADPSHDSRNFEFVTPVEISGQRYALELSYDHGAFDKQLARIRRVLLLVGLLALGMGGAIFYLIGGRSLLRSHRIALQRATCDGLTDLPNQRAFDDELPRAVASADRHQEPLALAILDVDDFKFVNDRHGHAHGDRLLQRVAHILRQGRAEDRGYRIGGDEFAVVLAHTDAGGAAVLARRLAAAGREAGLSVSIGVSVLRHGQRADVLRAEADAAVYEAKRLGGDQIVDFADIRERTFVTSAEQRAAVRRLLDEGRLSTVYQPIWDLHGKTLLGVEALSRPHPDYGLSSPAEAFDIAEKSGRVHQLDVLCVTNALMIGAELPPGALLFINLCPQTLDLDADRNEWLLHAVAEAGLSPEGIVIEVTERFGGRTVSVAKCLRRLRAHGFKIALDDVGAGNSGLEILRAVRADFVKLDRSIVAAAATEPSARAMLMALATFAHQTGAYVIAEGIEDRDTLDALRHLHEDLPSSPEAMIQGGQGYGLGRPTSTIATTLPAPLRSAQPAVLDPLTLA